MALVTTTVHFRYDSLGRNLEESQVYAGGTARNVTNQAFTSSPVKTFTFPQGRQISHIYDALYRRTLVEETSGGADIAAWKFFGPSRVAEVTLGNGLICTWMNNARTHSAVQPTVSNPSWGDQDSDRLGYDGAGRPITKRFLAGGINGTTHAYNDPTAVVGFTTSYDHASNKLYERGLHAENRSHLYQPYDADNLPTGGYDSLNRLRQYQRGTLSSTGGPGNAGGGSVSTPITLTNTNESAEYDLDGLGNWRRFTTDPVGGSATTQVRQHNGLNEITRVDSTPFSYDGTVGASNGNLKNDGTLKYEWDALNRLCVVKRVSDDATIGTYTYDALNRRIKIVITNGGLSGTVPNGTTDCLYEGWRCVEERDGSNNPTKQFVWGIYLDEFLQQKNITTLNNFGTNAALYPLQDLLYRTMALADSAGTIREAYDYDAYGNTVIFRNSGSPPSAITWSSDTQVVNPTCSFLFTGQRFNAETTNYYYKNRYYSPRWGRFLSRDPIVLMIRPSPDPLGANANVNLYEYVGSSPVSRTDPSGLKPYTGKRFTWEDFTEVENLPYNARVTPFWTPKWRMTQPRCWAVPDPFCDECTRWICFTFTQQVTIKTDYKLEVSKLLLPWMKSNELLAHEMGHVYISEAFARMTEAALWWVVGVGTDCRKGRASLNSRDNWEHNMFLVYTTGIAAQRAAQVLYDLLTDHGGGAE